MEEVICAGWDHLLMSEARTVTASPPKVLTGAVRLRALTVDDWVVEQQLSRDPEVVKWTYYPSDMDERQSRQRIAESQAVRMPAWRSATSSSIRRVNALAHAGSGACRPRLRRSSTPSCRRRVGVVPRRKPLDCSPRG